MRGDCQSEINPVILDPDLRVALLQRLAATFNFILII